MSGADNSSQALTDLTGGLDGYCFRFIGYPGWRCYVAQDFSFGEIVRELAIEIDRQVPTAGAVTGHSLCCQPGIDGTMTVLKREGKCGYSMFLNARGRLRRLCIASIFVDGVNACHGSYCSD